MRKWYDEEWVFTITVLKVGLNDYAEECRLGFEPGDRFECQYECPGGFCPTALMHIFPIMEIIRCDGDLRNLGSQHPRKTEIPCPDGAVTFRVEGRKNRRIGLLSEREDG